jgi:hypothetical protein
VLSHRSCKMPVMRPQRLVAHHLHAHTRNADESEQEGVTVTINADAYYAPTVKRMLEFLYHGEYDIGTAQESVKGDNDNKLTAFDVLSHVCCYAIGEDYQVGGLCAQALRNFSESLCTVSPDEFAEVMAAIATYTEAEPVHKALRSVAASRQNELAACKSFIKTLGCGHITIPATQDPGEARGLKAAKQLTVHGAELFRVANHTTAVANIEKAKLVKVYQAALRKIDQLRSQVDRDSSTLIMDERIHNDAKDALLASEATAKQAKEERLASEERASRMAQAIQKMKLDLEVLRNAEHNNKLAVEKANKEAATLRLALEETRQNAAAESATFLMALEASRVQAVCEQEKAADIQRQATDQREKSKMEASASQPTLAKVQYERDQALEEQFKTAQSLEAANQDLIALRMRLHKIAAADDTTLEAINQERDQMKGWQKVTVQKLESANQEVADLQKRLNAATAENQVLHEQTMRDRIALSEGAKLLKASKQAAERSHGQKSGGHYQSQSRGEPDQTSKLHSAAVDLRPSVPNSQRRRE